MRETDEGDRFRVCSYKIGRLPSGFRTLRGICTKRYYQEAIRYIAERVENPVFYIFSDDLDQAVDMLSEYPFRVVTENRGTDSYKDMYLMSKCRYHIITNSTFSWWGAWLDDREDKVVITPEKWNNLCKAHDICCRGWIMI